ncbi:Capsular polysaccharide biosynthesis protein [Paramagnetospirillum magnetotacticum MS-1]|uniref:Capsular polysaccharide biosynthesis protein n=2 Tax=Paramagnetospirillum magnetotacticum TaxID=188 RepID=A0A0C2V3C1_PARME|nr:Capsular polysaccharide biosynthesis protein [Paramagnetospirillum magnetotacticum MS-1]
MFIRLAIAFVALRLFGQGINAALSAWTFGLIFELAISALALRDVMRVPAAPLPAGIFRRMVRFAIPALASTTMFIFMWNVDIILARLYCSPYDSGLYANAAIIGHIALFLPAALVNVLLPHVAKAHKEGLSGGGALAASLALCVVLSGGFCLLCLIWSEEIISLLFGAKFIPAAPILQLLSPAMALLSLCNVLINFSMARNRFSFIKVLALGAGLVPALVYAFHADGRTIALIMLGVSALILAGITLTLTIEERKQA